MKPLLLLAGLLLGFCATRAEADLQPTLAPPVQGMLCRQAIGAAERASGIPDHLLAAIGRVESGRRDPASGASHPWPWTINVEGQGHFYDTKAAAIAAVLAFQAQGARSIDVGCMQVSLLYHPDAFASLDLAFDPQTNASWAAHFLGQLYRQVNSWPQAAGLYHSATPELGAEYQQKVMALLTEEQRNGPTPPMAGLWASAGLRGPIMGSAPPVGAGPMLLMSRATPAHIIPMLGGAPAGRGLDAYRAAPVTLAAR